MKIPLFLLKRKAEVNYAANQTLRPIPRISLPVFPFELSVDTASNRMIDVMGLLKVLKRSTFFLHLNASAKL
jgi:hypothetical protein